MFFITTDMSNFKLDEKDYIELYPLLSPREITETFGTMALGERAIEKLYKSHGLLSNKRALGIILERSYAIADTKVASTVWRIWAWQTIAKERNRRIARIFERAERYKELYK